MSTPPIPDPAYEMVLRETQRRVEITASDADLASMHRGRRRLDHRAAEIVRLLDILKRAQKKLKGRHDALLAESEAIGQIADREKVERLVLCEVVHDARQGGVIFIRQKSSRETIQNSYRPLSAEERNIFAGLKAQPDLIPGMSPTVDEELAKKLRLSEYLADAAPADIDVQIEEALAASALAPDLQDALLTIEADADEEDEKPKAKKPKKEKAPAPPKETKPKGKGGRKKSPPPPPPPDEEDEADGDDEPGPAEMEADEPEKPTLPRRPDAPRAVPQRDEDEPGDDASEEESSEDVPDFVASEDDASPAAEETTGVDAAVDDDIAETSEAPADEEDVASDEEALGAEFLEADDDEDAPGESEDVEPTDDEAPADPYPGAYDAETDDGSDPAWVDDSATLPVVDDEPAPAAPDPEPLPEPEPIAKADEPPPALAATPTKKGAGKKKAITVGWVRGQGFPGGPLAHHDATSAPANITFTYYVLDEVDREDARPHAETWAAAWVKEGALSVKLVPVIDPVKAPKPPEPAPPPAPAPSKAVPDIMPASERNVGNDFGLAPNIAKLYGDAVLQQIRKAPFLASTAIAAMEQHFRAVMTDNMKLALLPVLEHMASEGTIKRHVAGTDMIYYLHEPEGGFEAWRLTQRRK